MQEIPLPLHSKEEPNTSYYDENWKLIPKERPMFVPVVSESDPYQTKDFINHQARVDKETRRQQLWIDVYLVEFKRETFQHKEEYDISNEATQCANLALAQFDKTFSSPES